MFQHFDWSAKNGLNVLLNWNQKKLPQKNKLNWISFRKWVCLSASFGLCWEHRLDVSYCTENRQCDTQTRPDRTHWLLWSFHLQNVLMELCLILTFFVFTLKIIWKCFFHLIFYLIIQFEFYFFRPSNLFTLFESGTDLLNQFDFNNKWTKVQPLKLNVWMFECLSKLVSRELCCL